MTDIRSIDLGAMLAPLHQAVGEALSAFGQMEGVMGAIYQRLIRAQHPGLASIAFDAVQLTSPKIRVLTSVANAAMAADDFKRLQRCLKRIQARTEMRVKLAHWTVNIWSPDEMPISRSDARIEARVVPPWFSAKGAAFDPADTVTLDQIKQFTRDCGAITTDLLAFITKPHDGIGGSEEI